MFCKHCGAENPNDAAFCASCGRPQNDQPQQPMQQPQPQVVYNSVNNTTVVDPTKRGPFNKWLTFIFAFFFGYIGVHKFYEGKIGMGVLYILTGGLFGIGVLVDWIVALTRPNPYYL